MQDKAALRRQLRRRRIAITPSQRRQAERRVAARLLRSGLLHAGLRVGVYLAAGSELSLDAFIAVAQRQRVQCFAPVVPARGRILRFAALASRAGTWRRNRHGIREYRSRATMSAQQMQVILLPLLGFDRLGGRLGQGGGFYDATLAFRRLVCKQKQPRLLGIAFDCQRVEQPLLLEAHDVRLDEIITEAARYRPLRGMDRAPHITIESAQS